MLGSRFFLIACALAALAPFVPWTTSAKPIERAFPGWPTHFEGRKLTPAPLSAQEENFQTGFPGRIAKFTDGQRTIVMRWVTGETRKLHPAADCFRASGYRVVALPLQKDAHEQLWGSFRATRGQESLQLLELIYDESGNSWTDVSAWYWAALLGRSAGPWWAVTVVESRGESRQ